MLIEAKDSDGVVVYFNKEHITFISKTRPCVLDGTRYTEIHFVGGKSIILSNHSYSLQAIISLINE